MKTVPRVDLEGIFVEDEIVSVDFSGVQAVYREEPFSDLLGEGEESETPTPEVIGYLIDIPVPSGLFRPQFDLVAWRDQVKGVEYWNENLTLEEIEELTRPQEAELSDFERIGMALVQRELEALELRQQNEALGAQIVQKELQMMNLQAQNEALGASLVGFELRLISLEGGVTNV